MKTYELIVTGRVQQVGFRYHALQCASQLGLLGNVRNLSDGNVKILLQCQQDELDAFIQLLQTTKHRWIKISSINVTVLHLDKQYTSFKIVH